MIPPVIVPAPPDWKRQLVSVGVTGTNGKTSTTAMVAAALAAAARPVARATTVGSFLDDEELDVPKSYDGFLQTMRRALEGGGRFVALELTSEALLRGFAKAWPCDVGVFTNLTHDHLDAHGSFEHYLASKAQLFVNLAGSGGKPGVAVLNACDPVSSMLAEVLPAGTRLLRYGVPSRGEPVMPLDLRGDVVELSWERTRVAVTTSPRFGPAPATLDLRAIGDVFAENALGAWAGAVAAGVSAEVAARALSAAAPPPGRFEVVARAPYVVVDYAHTPDALARTLYSARRLCKGTLTVVFGAGGNRDKEKRAPMGLAASTADRVILTSDNPRDEDPREIAAAIRSGITGTAHVEVELDRRKAIALALAGAGVEDVIVVAGKGHETEQVAAGTTRAFSDPEIVREALGSS